MQVTGYDERGERWMMMLEELKVADATPEEEDKWGVDQQLHELRKGQQRLQESLEDVISRLSLRDFNESAASIRSSVNKSMSMQSPRV